jgi:hypothetical protein
MKRLTILLSALLGASLLTISAFAIVPGTGNGPANPPSRSLGDVQIVETGHISLSVDGCGTNFASTPVDVFKPNASATVRSAYLSAASTGWCYCAIPDGAVTLDGNGISWDVVIENGINSYNHWADVTDIIAAIIDPAGAGVTSITVAEASTYDVDGEALYVIFDDPEQATINTVLISFGAQSTGGDTFFIGFGEPVEIVPDMVMDLGLAISFGNQVNSDQYSEVDVNGTRMTSCAGGNDDADGAMSNGNLITVGGSNDSNDNPPDPWQIADGNSDWTFYDDELYNMLPFVDDGDVGLNVYTLNPSADDNIFSAHILMTVAAVIGEGIVLTPGIGWHLVGETHTLTASIQDDLGEPVVDRLVTIEILSGPNDALSSGGPTDANGQFEWTYVGGGVGVDNARASFMDNEGVTQYSNIAEVIWDSATGVDVPETTSLNQNYPNPFNPTTTIGFSLTTPGQVELTVSNQNGQVVATLVNGTLPVGNHTVEFDSGQLPSGIYYYTMKAENQTFTRKMVLLK